MKKNMKKIENPEAFHKALAQALLEFANEQEETPIEFFDEEVYVGELTINCNVAFHYEVHDESFDHLFGTWRDPNPYLVATGVKELEILSVSDDDGQQYEGWDANKIIGKFN